MSCLPGERERMNGSGIRLQQLLLGRSPLAGVAGAVLVLRAPCTAADAVYVLVALGGVLGEVDACIEEKRETLLRWQSLE